MAGSNEPDMWNKRMTEQPTIAECREWQRVHTVDEMETFYLSRLPLIREAAKTCGYAIGLHGSCRRDFDLMAMPWVETAAEPDELARAIQKAACGFRNERYQWEKKPNGRIATAFPICWTGDMPKLLSIGHIDLSVIDNRAHLLEYEKLKVVAEKIAAALEYIEGELKAAEWHDPHGMSKIDEALAEYSKVVDK